MTLGIESAAEEQARINVYLNASSAEQERMRLFLKFDAASQRFHDITELLGNEAAEPYRVAILALREQYPEAHSEWARLKIQ